MNISFLTPCEAGSLHGNPGRVIPSKIRCVHINTFNDPRNSQLDDAPIMSWLSLAPCLPTIHPFTKRCEDTFSPLRCFRLYVSEMEKPLGYGTLCSRPKHQILDFNKIILSSLKEDLIYKNWEAHCKKSAKMMILNHPSQSSKFTSLMHGKGQESAP